MGFFEGISSIFSGGSSSTNNPQGPAPQNFMPQQGQNQPPLQQQLPNGQGTSVLENPAATTTQNQPMQIPHASTPADQTPQKASPLDDFKDLWSNPPVDPANPKKGPPTLNTDPQKIAEAAKKLNFSRSVDPALVQKALAGDQQAFMNVLNNVAQQTFALAAQAATQVVGRHTDNVREHIMSELPSHLKSFAAQDNLLSENPAFSNPAVQPLVLAVQEQLARKFPEATSDQLRKHAIKYLQQVGAIISAPSSAEGEQTPGEPLGGSRIGQKKQDIDWLNWATTNPQ